MFIEIHSGSPALNGRPLRSPDLCARYMKMYALARLKSECGGDLFENDDLDASIGVAAVGGRI